MVRPRCLDAALAYAELGWMPLPMHWGRPDGSCSCRLGATCSTPGKHPLVRWSELNDVSVDDLHRWWQTWPFAGVAIATGYRSNVVVVDVDPGHGGAKGLRHLTDVHGPLPDTLTVASGGGGVHAYFSRPSRPVMSTAGQLAAGLDVRGDGGVIVAPPTRHASGLRYRWQNWGTPIAVLPEWLYAAARQVMIRNVTRQLPPLASTRGDRYVQAALEGEVRRVESSVVGVRRTTLNIAAFNLATLVGAGRISAGVVGHRLFAAGLSVGMEPRRVEKTIRDALHDGIIHSRNAES